MREQQRWTATALDPWGSPPTGGASWSARLHHRPGHRVLPWSARRSTADHRDGATGSIRRADPHENNYSPTAPGSPPPSAENLPGDQNSVGHQDRTAVMTRSRADRVPDRRQQRLLHRHRWDAEAEPAEGVSAAVRPMAVAPDQRHIYFQVSYFTASRRFDTQAPDIDGKVTTTPPAASLSPGSAVTRLIDLPNRVPDMPLEEYVNALRPPRALREHGGTEACGRTMDDYAARRPHHRHVPALRRDHHGARLQEAPLDHRGTGRHLLDLAPATPTRWPSSTHHRRRARLPAGRRPPLAHPARLRPRDRRRDGPAWGPTWPELHRGAEGSFPPSRPSWAGAVPRESAAVPCGDLPLLPDAGRPRRQ